MAGRLPSLWLHYPFVLGESDHPCSVEGSFEALRYRRYHLRPTVHLERTARYLGRSNWRSQNCTESIGPSILFVIDVDRDIPLRNQNDKNKVDEIQNKRRKTKNVIILCVFSPSPFFLSCLSCLSFSSESPLPTKTLVTDVKTRPGNLQ